VEVEMMVVWGLSRGIDDVAAAAVVLGRFAASVTAGFALPAERDWWHRVRYR
jgi:hypothetical protein